MTDAPVRRSTTTDIRAAKGAGEPLACLTCYTAQMARAIDGHVDLILVGDSLGMTIYGFDTTLPVTPRHDDRAWPGGGPRNPVDICRGGPSVGSYEASPDRRSEALRGSSRKQERRRSSSKGAPRWRIRFASWSTGEYQ